MIAGAEAASCRLIGVSAQLHLQPNFSPFLQKLFCINQGHADLTAPHHGLPYKSISSVACRLVRAINTQSPLRLPSSHDLSIGMREQGHYCGAVQFRVFIESQGH